MIDRNLYLGPYVLTSPMKRSEVYEIACERLNERIVPAFIRHALSGSGGGTYWVPNVPWDRSGLYGHLDNVDEPMIRDTPDAQDREDAINAFEKAFEYEINTLRSVVVNDELHVCFGLLKWSS